MSEELLKLIQEERIEREKLQERIEMLETKVDANWKYINGEHISKWQNQLNERIEKLERDNALLWNSNGMRIDELAELKEQIEKLSGGEHDCQYKRALEEIKEQFYRNELTDKDMEDIISGGDIKPTGVDFCYQRVYCNECLAYPMGFGCPNKEGGETSDSSNILKADPVGTSDSSSILRAGPVRTSDSSNILKRNGKRG